MAQSKEADMTKLVETMLKISNSVAEKRCPRSNALITELENHYVTFRTLLSQENLLKQTELISLKKKLY